MERARDALVCRAATSTAGALWHRGGIGTFGPMAVMERPFGATQTRMPSPEAAPLRRCTFRRVTAGGERGSDLPVYEVACMFPDRRKAVPLGDIESARPICSACTYQGIFRADSD